VNEKIFIIAEAGVNHNGNIDLAFKLVDAAQKAGVDAIKFQTFKTEKVVSGKTEMADYQKANLGTNETQFELIKKLELSFEQFAKLKEYCERQGIMFLSTPDEEDSLDFLADDLKVPLIKVGSGEITNFPYLERIAQKKLPIILSTGMANLSNKNHSGKTSLSGRDFLSPTNFIALYNQLPHFI
jgi:N,N'-diacetyllegionaminate synthase